jgi:GPH family glycoside/pentoside/hexuronide:cation symporter
MMAIGNSAGAYYMTYNLDAPQMLPYFMALGSIPAFIFMPMVPAIKRAIGKKQMFYVFLSVAIVGMGMLYLVPVLGNQIWLVMVAQFIKSTGVIVATGYMWALVPEVISFGEYNTGRRISGIVNALTGLFFKAGMALGGVVPGLVLAFVHFDANLPTQSALAEQGILLLVAGIPMLLLLLAIFFISKYELDDNLVDKINIEIEQRHLND